MRHREVNATEPRLSRSLKDLLLVLEKIEAEGASFKSLTEAIDTSAPAGRMMMQIVGSFAEFERAMLRERTGNCQASCRLNDEILCRFLFRLFPYKYNICSRGLFWIEVHDFCPFPVTRCARPTLWMGCAGGFVDCHSLL